MHAGSILDGKYRLERKIGVGGMGSVWRAHHRDFDAPVAVKLLNADLADSSEALERFTLEAKAAANLRSPHVVQVLAYGVDRDSRMPFMVMELLEGESLASRLQRGEPLPPAQAARVITHVARALSRAHELGIIHRDLKPANIFLVNNSDEQVAKVLDFGVAKWAGQADATATGRVLGTPRYMSPEQVTAAKQIDARSDLWSLGVIAWECLTGQQAFEADNLATLALRITQRRIESPSRVASVPIGFDAWFERATALVLSERFQSASEMALRLREVCAVTATSQWPPGLAPRMALEVTAPATPPNPASAQTRAEPPGDNLVANKSGGSHAPVVSSHPRSLKAASVSKAPGTHARSIGAVLALSMLALVGLWFAVNDSERNSSGHRGVVSGRMPMPVRVGANSTRVSSFEVRRPLRPAPDAVSLAHGASAPERPKVAPVRAEPATILPLPPVATPSKPSKVDGSGHRGAERAVSPRSVRARTPVSDRAEPVVLDPFDTH